MKTSKGRATKIPAKFYKGPILCHFVKQIKDGPTSVIIFRFWNVGYQRWVYLAETKKDFDGYFAAGTYAVIKPERFKNQKIFFLTEKQAQQQPYND